MVQQVARIVGKQFPSLINVVSGGGSIKSDSWRLLSGSLVLEAALGKHGVGLS